MKNDEIKYSEILKKAVTEKGLMMRAYSAFHNYSTMNQLMIMVQMSVRGMEIAPVATFKKWQEKNRKVKKGEKALAILCPVTIKKDKEDPESDKFTFFQWRNCLFALHQTEGENYKPEQIEIKEFNKENALKKLGIVEVEFHHLNGNVQGYAKENEIAINPLAEFKIKTMFHEMAHIVLGHTKENPMTDESTTPKNIKEVEAESVALLCLESLGIPGAEFCRGYIQNWLLTDEISDTSAKKIMAAANKILKAGTEEEVN